METLTADEARVLGVLIEKAMTTPDLYPLTLNALVNGCNQKNNREPVAQVDDDRAYDAAESLRGKGYVARVDQVGARTHKYKHVIGEKLNLRGAELAILAELLLRGPQTVGEIRGRASRMHALETVEVVKGHLDAMAGRGEPLVREIPGGRATRYVQLLSPDLHSISEPAAAADSTAPAAAAATGGGAVSLGDRVRVLEGEVASLKAVIRKMAAALGEADPFPAADEPPAASES